MSTDYSFAHLKDQRLYARIAQKASEFSQASLAVAITFYVCSLLYALSVAKRFDAQLNVRTTSSDIFLRTGHALVANRFS